MINKYQVVFCPADTKNYPFKYSLVSFSTKEEAERVAVEAALGKQSFLLTGTDFVQKSTTEIPGAYSVVESDSNKN